MKHRPRLRDDVTAHRHVIDGVERIVIQRPGAAQPLFIEQRHAAWLGYADGTRDLDGIALAIARAGTYERASDIEGFFAELDKAGALADGIERGPRPRPSRASSFARETPVHALPNYLLHCDGRGMCCRQSMAVPFSRAEALRARRTGLRTLDDDVEEERVFLPLYGGVRTEELAITMVDGRCLELDDDDLCALHKKGGAIAKPLLCRLYPATFTFDGSRIVVSAVVECECVLSSLDDPTRGAPLVDAAVRSAGDLDPETIIVRLPERILVSPGVTAPADEYVAWVDRILDALPSDRSGVETCLIFARAIADEGLEASVAKWPSMKAKAMAKDLAWPVRSMLERMRVTVAGDSWRSKRDPARRNRKATLSALEAIEKHGVLKVLATDPHPAAERFTLRAMLFGHHFGLLGSVVESLRDVAARFLVARELHQSNTSNQHPIIRVLPSIPEGG